MGKFVLLKGSDGQYYFNLLAGNGKVILVSEAYETDTERKDAISLLHARSFDEGRYERKISADGRYYFVLRTATGEVIGKSELYGSEAGRDNGIESVKNNARDAEIEDGGGEI